MVYERTYSLQVTLHVTDIPTSRATGVTGRDFNHALVQSLLVEDPVTDDLETFDISSLLKDRG